ncbi:hypothetical protein GW17_00004394 [Ensete ventricosum]|nr:hypothetical protein GW17_00004394 [Ensete ventricosum]
MRRFRSLLLVPFSFLASSPGARKRKPTDEDSPAGDESRGTGEDQLVPPSFLPYLLLPLLPQLTTDNRNRPSTTEIDCRRSILTVSPGSGRSAYRYPVGLVHTARTKRYRTKWRTLHISNPNLGSKNAEEKNVVNGIQVGQINWASHVYNCIPQENAIELQQKCMPSQARPP